MLTKRDELVIEFLEQFKVATTSTIEYFFYPSKRVAQRRLKILTEDKYIKRSKMYVNEDYYYYIERPDQVKHHLMITEFYHYFSTKFDVKRYQVQKQIGTIIPDATIGYVENGFKKVAFLEVEISNNGFDYDKYLNFNYKNYFNTMPDVFVVTKQRLKPHKTVNFIQIKDIKADLDRIFNQTRIFAIR